MKTPDIQNYKTDFHQKISVELQLIIALLNKRYITQRQLITQLLNQISWQVFLKLLRRHRLTILLQILIENFNDHISKNLIEQLKTNLYKERFIQMNRLPDIQLISEVFIKSEISHIFFKGHVLGGLFFQHVSDRFSVDTDILCEKQNIKKADYLLTGLGYERKSAKPGLLSKLNFTRKDLKYVKADTNHLVELHFRLLPDITSKKFSRDILQRKEIQTINNQKYSVPDIYDHFIFVMLHGTIHQFFRLFWLRDCFEFVQQFNTRDWKEISQRVKEYGLEKYMSLNFSLLNIFFDFIADASLEYKDNDQEKLLVQTLNSISGPVNETFYKRFSRLMFMLRLRKNMKYKIMIIISGMLRFLFKSDR